ncbi:hypothetical protein EXM90_12190 [Clostridium botulinum]|uniref:hypothetical protein n=1 Tax=Clostridium botulinum TaxID=1491 RepID=UPI0007741AB5|nr:hypothetical protein [Clostridium botulinum]MBN3352132.1 hypothetical protein [Clostridium botulinum]MBN3367095.1 hypothetical protein [Clostridium botulinum]MBN3371731.1 hypothetical protein [Clostridium botulinum]MBN3375463.1 hypothetical protein [Clostridium botulinum]MBN3384372.1 hypothetical protein [Clostridium botulinum]
MKWDNIKNKLIHEKEYLVCLDIKNETYSLQNYFKYADGDIIFEKEGFYYFDVNEDVFKYSYRQPKFWMAITNPTI